VDLRFLAAEPTEAERDALDAVVGAATGWSGGERTAADTRTASTGAAARCRRHLLLPALHALNDRVGWITPGGLNEVCRRLLVPPADAYGVATFYGLFSMEPRSRRVLHVCDDLACAMANPVSHALPSEVDVLPSPCLGVCERAPAALLLDAGPTPEARVMAPEVDAVPQAGDPSLVLLHRVGRVDPTSLAAYRGDGGFEALRVAFELHESKLLGRGGAAFPAGRKWEAVARQPNHPHELVCNADESEPGTFKDRVLMEGDPFAVLEAVMVAGVTVGAEHGWIYLRGEYPLARQRLQHAIDECRAFGYLGDDVMGRGVRFDVEIFRGAGAYICGEETAIFNSIEGQRGEPRNKPPFPVDAGLFGHPTLVNNVETLVNVLPILRHGGATYAATGTAGSTGPKLFCLSGKVAVPGVYEVPFGTTLGELLGRAGGVAGDRPLQAVLLGGAAGGFAGPADLDVPLTFEDTRAAGLTLGSGVVMVLDDTVELMPFLLRIAAFFRDESCGQCVPCRVGTVRQEEALLRLAASRDQSSSSSSGPSGPSAGDLALLDDLARVMQDASICGLGQTAANAIQSALSRLAVLS
jgi:NADH-quinone oxidoreductase subunit F